MDTTKRKILEKALGQLQDKVDDGVLDELRTLLADEAKPLQRKQVSVIFADLSGFTAMSERLDPEEVREILTECFEELVDVIESHDGTVEKYIGDCIVAIFGAPKAQEDHAIKALKTSLGLLQRLEQFNGRRGLDLGLHIGVNSGLVVAGDIRAGSTSQYAVTGDTVNLAARLEGQSTTGQILAGPESYRLARHAFHFGPPLLLELKGKKLPVAARLLLGESEQVLPPLTTLFGRESEMAQLNATLQKAGITEVLGAPGLGKTFLAQHLAEELGSVVWVEARADSKNEPYGVFRHLLQALVSEDLTQRSLLEFVKHHELEVPAENLFPLMGDPIPKLTETSAIQAAVRIATTQFFEQLPSISPVIFFFDDGQWADRSSLELLKHLNEQQAITALILSRHTLAQEGFQKIELPPLSSSATQEYLSDLLPGVKTKQVKEMASRSSGHPLFARELAFQFEEAGGKGSLPGSLQAAVMSRVDDLPSEVKETLEFAATIGPECDFQTLESLAPNLHVALSQGQLVRLEGERLGFKHKLVQEAVYESLSLRRRRKLHQKVADHLATGPTPSSVLAYHYSAAESWELARKYLSQVAQESASLAADAEILESFQRSLELRKMSTSAPQDLVDLVQTERQLGEVKLRQGELAEATKHLRRAAEHLGFTIPSTRWAVRARLLRAISRWALRLPSEDMPQTKTLRGELFRILIGLCHAEVSQPENFLLYSFEHLVAAKTCKDFEGIAVGQSGFGMAFDFAGAPRLASYFHSQARKSISRCRGHFTHAIVNLGSGVHAGLLGQSSMARVYLQEALHRSELAGDVKTWSTAAVELATLQANSGELEQARELTTKMIEMGRKSGDKQCAAWGGLVVGRIELLQENFSAAKAGLVEVEQALLEADDLFCTVLAQAYSALACLGLHALDEAEEIIERAESLVAKNDIRGHLVGWISIARAELELKKPNTGASQCVKWAKLAIDKTSHTIAGPGNGLRVLGNAYWKAGKTEEAKKAWSKAEKRCLKRGELLVAAQVRYERSQALGSPSYANLKEAFLSYDS